MDDFLKSIKLSLAEGGIVVLSVPDCGRFLEHGDINGFLHEHLTYFTVASLRATLAFAGLNIIKIVSTRDLFSVIVSHGSVCAVAIEQLDERERLKKFHARMERLLDKVVPMIRRRVLAGEKVGFHGATNGLNILCHIAGLQNLPIYIFDGDSTKTGRYLPASNSKIRNINDPLYRQIDMMVVSAMSFEEEIRADAVSRAGLSGENILPMLGVAGA